MRNIPVELVTRYEEAGWWTRETLGQVLAAGLHAAPDARFRAYSAVRPWSGTLRDVEEVARRLLAENAKYFSAETSVEARVVCDLEWFDDSSSENDEVVDAGCPPA